MTDLFWPGDGRAGALMTDRAWLDSMVAVEQAWLDTLAGAGIAPVSAALSLLIDDDVERVARAAEQAGNPVVALVQLLRERTTNDAAPWVHRGLTSQDVADTGLMLCVRDVRARLREELGLQVAALERLARDHRGTVMVARTLTQHAVPTTFGLKVAGWLSAVLDAADGLDSLRLPVQVGGAAGTLSAVTDLTAAAGDPARAALDLITRIADDLQLDHGMPWHTSRRAITAIGDALVACTDAWGRIAADVALMSRPEVGELSEPRAAGRGGSSTMPHKQNPVLSILLRRAAIAAPGLGSTLHLAAALAGDERPDGAWHTEWATLRSLARRCVVAASQTTELVGGMAVNVERMRLTLDAAGSDLYSERAALADVTGVSPLDTSYLGAAGDIIDRVLDRAADYLGRRA